MTMRIQAHSLFYYFSRTILNYLLYFYFSKPHCVAFFGVFSSLFSFDFCAFMIILKVKKFFNDERSI